MAEHFDFIVIGGGSAGYSAARTVRARRDRVAVIDAGAELGGLCILRGCMPSKTLIYIGEIAHLAREGKRFGLKIPTVEADMRAIRERKRAKVAEFKKDRIANLQSDRFTLYRQKASFTDPETIELEDGTELTADAFLVSTGSVINWPGIPGLDEVGALTSDDILELDRLPKTMIALGGGVVACELTQYLSRLGCRITQIQRSPTILKDMTPEAGQTLGKVFREEGIDLQTATSLKSLEKLETGMIRAIYEKDGLEHAAEGEIVFNALGRKPNTQGLNLENAGIELSPTGHIATSGAQQTSNPKIYAAGDVAGPHEIVHVAVEQGAIAARHFLGDSPRPFSYEKLMGVVFTDPQIGIVGLTEVQAQADGFDCVCASFPFDDHGKSITMDAFAGYVKLVADRATGRLLGAECVGKDGGELIHAMTYPVAARVPVKDLLRADWYHPTLSEIWEYPIEDIVDELGL